MTVKKLIDTLKQMPQNLKILEYTERIQGEYYIVYGINWMELQRAKLK